MLISVVHFLTCFGYPERTHQVAHLHGIILYTLYDPGSVQKGLLLSNSLSHTGTWSRRATGDF